MGSKSRGFQAPSVELRGFHGTLEPPQIRPCISELEKYIDDEISKQALKEKQELQEVLKFPIEIFWN